MIEKQIEEMAQDICEWYRHGICSLDDKECDLQCTKGSIVEKLVNRGYRKQSEWISVEERLPDKEGTYLTYTDKDKMLMDVFLIYPSHGTKFWVGGNGKVTHWMPLPEAPKGGAE